MDIEVRSYQKPQEAQITSTMVECLQGIQIAKEATAQIRMDQEIQQIMMNTSPELMMLIQDVIYAQMPYRGGIISHNTSTNDMLSSDICMRWPRGSPRVIQLVWGYFGVFALIKFEI
jgi:metal-dependent amidase/aminoacylase/carboxypeptidase family protein